MMTMMMMMMCIVIHIRLEQMRTICVLSMSCSIEYMCGQYIVVLGNGLYWCMSLNYLFVIGFLVPIRVEMFYIIGK